MSEIEGVLFDPTYGNLERALELTAKKQQVIAHNIANANTPGFKPMRFDEELGKAVERNQDKVVLEQEMAELSKNSTQYSAYVKMLQAKLNVLKTVVTQGRK